MAKLTRRYVMLLTGVALLAVLSGCSQNKPAATQKFAFWPPAPDEPRLQYLCSFSKSTDVEPPKSNLDALIYGKESQEMLPLNKPYGVAMWNGRIYMCDIRSDCVTILDLRKHQTLVMGRGGTDKLVNPTAIAIADDGTKYVADSTKGMVCVFDAEDKQIGIFGHKDMKPVNVAVYQNELYVADFKGQRVEVWDRTSGDLLRTVGEPGQKDGQFIFPLGMAVDKDGNLYVADVLRCKIQKFDHDGKYLVSFADISANVGGLVRPKHIAVDKEGTVYAVDAAFQNVQLYDPQGRVLTFFGSPGDHPGAMLLPAGICVHEGDLDLFQKYVHPAFEAQRLVLVTNQFGDNKVSVYAFGHLKPGKTVKDIAFSSAAVAKGVTDPKTGNVIGVAATQPAPDDGKASAPATEPAEEPEAAPTAAPAAAPAPAPATQPSGE